MIRLELNEAEANYLADILSLWIDGHEDAAALTEKDPTFETADELLMMTAGLVEQKSMAQTMLMKLKEATFSG
jgi:hypothetical protein